MLSSLVRNLCALRKGYPIFRKNRFPLCVMHPYHLGNPVLPTAAAMAGRGDGSGVGQPLLHPLFVPRRSQGQLSSLATSVRLDMSIPADHPDPYLRVTGLSKLTPGLTRIRGKQVPGPAGQVLMGISADLTCGYL